jgi:N-acetylglucosamine kinase-like BadF-type ATPase
VSDRVLLAVDGGNSKTHVAVAREDGSLLALAAGPLSSPHHLGVGGCVDLLERLVGAAAAEAGVDPPVDVGRVMLAGVDLPGEEETLQAALDERPWGRNLRVGNDTFAVLRAGTDRPWGIAVVCGSGINCVGVAADGRHARFPALGAITGDWGGGYDIGLAALHAAARAEDGRGPGTTLERAVPAFFGLETPQEVAEAIHAGRIPQRRLERLAPTVFAEASHDPVAAEILERLVREVAAMARVAIERLGIEREPVEVLLGGGVLQNGDGPLIDCIAASLQRVGPSISVRRTASPPIVGAALLALDDLGADGPAQARLREELDAAVARLPEPRMEPVG